MKCVPSAILNAIKLDELLDWAIEKADPFSQLGLLELAVQRMPIDPEMEEKLISIVEQLLDKDTYAEGGRLYLMSANYALVEGELSHAKILTSWLPHQRRLASMAQAAMITRRTMIEGDVKRFCKWAYEQRGYSFYCQSLIDLRSEPRWLPDLAAPEQFYREIIGRLAAIPNMYAKYLSDGPLKNKLVGDDSGALPINLTIQSFWPGPLEGTYQKPNPLPDEIRQIVEGKLHSPILDASVVIPLINIRPSFGVEGSYIDRLISSFKEKHHRISTSDQKELDAMLMGLAAVCASERRVDLVGELRVLARVSRRSSGPHISAVQELRIAVIAAAAHTKFVAWRDFIADWATELSLEVTDVEIAKQLIVELNEYGHNEPRLHMTLGRPLAALEAYTRI